MFDNFKTGLGNLPYLLDAVSRCITAENPTGEKGGSCKATEGTGAHCAKDLGKGWKISPSIKIPSGTIATLANIKAEGLIQSIWIGGDITRDLILRIYWDGSETPAVECPLPDFFGNGWMNNLKSPFSGPFHPLNSIPVCINPNNALNCFWPMPFKTGFKVTLQNRAKRDFITYYQINISEQKLTQEVGYFHAQFRRTNPIPFKKTHTILTGIEGQGNYVGTVLSVGLNGGGNWWGEGEVKFYLDGDSKYPTISTTGTEDYFCGSYDWEVDGKYTTYSTPFSGMFYVHSGDGLYDHQQRFAMYRWHIMDPIRFKQDISIEIQDLGWYEVGERYMPRQDDFATVAFFYLNKPFTKLPILPNKDYLENI